jgi:plasmid stability protein
MPRTLSIKNVPDHIYERLRKKATEHHRSLQGELMAILEAGLMEKETLSPVALLSKVHESGLQTPSESAEWVRQDRDGH